MATTGKRRLIKGAARRRSVDSDDNISLAITSPVSPSATTTDSMDSDEPYVKRPAQTIRKTKKKVQSLPTQFLDSFITQFTPEELAAKRTVEVIYGSSGSFAYTFRSLEETLFSPTCDSVVILSFLKALSAVADERFLRDLLSGTVTTAKAAHTGPAEVGPETLRNYELLLLGAVKRLDGLLTVDESAGDWAKLTSSLKCFLIDGLAGELRSLLSSLFTDADLSDGGIITCLGRLKSVATTLEGAILLNGRKSGATRKGKTNFGTAECVKSISRVEVMVSYLQEVHRLVSTTVANRPESEGLEALLHAIELLLGISNDSSKGDPVGVDFKVESLKLLLSNDGCDTLGSSNFKTESGFIRQKFENICLAFEEQRRQQQDHQAELAKKTKMKRDAVSYILARLSEVESANAPPSIRHPCYVVGIPPSKCTEEVIRRCGRKLKTLLHPDTEHDPEWKALAERAFKEASLALEKCVGYNSAYHTSTLRMAARPPFATYIGLALATENSSEGNQQSGVSTSDNVVTPPSLVLLPTFTASCMDRKTGSVNVILEASSFTMNGFSKLGKNKRLVVYMHRPTHGDEPSSFRVHRNLVSEVKSLSLPDAVQGKQLSVKIDAVQPIMFGNAWRYFVGIQLAGDLGTSLVVWNSLYVELSNKGRTAVHVGKLLKTFVGAPFVNQELLQNHLSRCRDGAKADAEAFLQECAKSAQRWADEQ
ncbi:uncharacterized protein BXIN_0203 [Babesia sp. Xinjiang]|uniref:uncharacterized protein n=1 Tax=Babesia sp. Xinjiang TaxID=462227 RepID=UPI000A217427|nr:uncharacterized protein BXIN_0203 [Babesia sp. Xinjiang]ORM39796.1 hypothetical protein BXIN_0203 [Babesia sp. Xinjiang]